MPARAGGVECDARKTDRLPQDRRIGRIRHLLVIAVLAAVGSVACVHGAGSERDAVVVPDVSGLRAREAFARLRQDGLRVSIPTAFRLASNQEPVVTGQRPQAGRRAERGATVALLLANGPIGLHAGSESDVVVPDVTGMSLRQAVERLRSLGLVWDAATLPPLPPSDAPGLLDAYTVSAQEPPAGSRYRQVAPYDVERGVGAKVTPVRLSVRASADA